MGISGNLSTIGLPDVLQLLSTGGKTGTLRVTRSSDVAHVYFQEGNIIYATSSTRKDALLNILVRNGHLALAQAERIRIRSRTGKNSIEKILQQGNFVSSELLLDAAMTQAKEIVYELFQWFNGNFEFMEGELPPGSAMELTVSLGAFKLIMEGARRIDEWSRIRKDIPSIDSVFILDEEPDPEKFQFSREDLVILSLIDGNTPVRKICQTTGNSEFEICRTLYGFKTAGLIRAVSRIPGPETRPVTKEPIYKSKTVLGATGGIVAVILVVLGFLIGGSGDPEETAVKTETPVVQSTISTADSPGTIPDTAIPTVSTALTTLMDSPVDNIPVDTATPVPDTPTPAPQATQPPPSRDASGRININIASSAELETLPRIGPATARNIIAYREKSGPFRTPRDIMNVSRIGIKTFEGLEPYITCGPGTASASAPQSQPQTDAPTPATSKSVSTGKKKSILIQPENRN